jgi:hypothetical protein
MTASDHTTANEAAELEYDHEPVPYLRLPKRGMPTLEDFDRELDELSYLEGLQE